ncbi:Chromobox protein 5 [Tritrichomonas musculus]|uniref:Chromobox protein 5 n=1 Tax=Tritrichomonas musculus TaxID=1915356 RepID=A0ABR2IBE5_9EUKA
MSDNEKEYIVEKICDHQIRKNKMYYLIKWKGYSESENTWEPENYLNCKELLNEYKAEHMFIYQDTQKNSKNMKKYEKKAISEIVGFKEGSTTQDMLYIVRFENDEGYTELPSSILRKWDLQKLLDFYEKNLPAND